MWPFQKKAPVSNLSIWLTAGIVVLLKALFIIFTSVRGLSSTTWLIDDSLIEMKIAENLGHGLGYTLDGVHTTTGAPFFWIYLSSLNHMFLGLESAFRATLIETAILGALATIVVFYLALKITADRRIAWTAFLLSTFTANAFFNGMNGMDTVLFTLLVLLSIATYLGVGRPAKWSNFSWGCMVGLMLGLTVMTRGDGIFVIMSIGLMALYEWWKAPQREKKDHRNLIAGMILVAGVCFAIFMGWQLIQTGSPFPANQVGRRQLSIDYHGFDFNHFALLPYLKIVVWNVFQLEDLLTLATGGFLLVLCAFVAGCFDPKMRKLGIITAMYTSVFFFLLVAYQWYFADLHGLRYINPAVHLFFIFVAWFLWQLPIQRGKTIAIIVIAVCLAISANYKHYQMCSRFRWAPVMSYISRPDPVKGAPLWTIIDWVRDNLPAGTIIGVRDYGRISLFTDAKIQDLAGNLDPPVSAALQDGTLDAYLKEKKVEYLLIPSLEQRADKLYTYLHTHLKLELVKAQAKDSPITGNLYKIIW